jgi:hypothetical protein
MKAVLLLALVAAAFVATEGELRVNLQCKWPGACVSVCDLALLHSATTGAGPWGSSTLSATDQHARPLERTFAINFFHATGCVIFSPSSMKSQPVSSESFHAPHVSL